MWIYNVRINFLYLLPSIFYLTFKLGRGCCRTLTIAIAFGDDLIILTRGKSTTEVEIYSNEATK